MSTMTAEATPQATTSPIVTIPTTRLIGVELRKMFDTRSGFWMMASIGMLATIATAAVIAFAPEEAITYETFASAIGIPMSVILPMIAVLSVTSEFSQRTGLTSFTLVPHRGRVLLAKAIGGVLVGVAGMVVALAIGAIGNLLGTTITGVDPVWDVTPGAFSRIVLAMVLTMAIGFMLGLVIRNSAGAIVGYFVYSFVLPTIFAALAAFQAWFRDLQPWIDFNYANTRLFDEVLTFEHWAQLGVTSVIWLVVPLLVGLRLVLRAEVK